ncbi:MAG TPA: 6-phosphofructokinase [Rhodospirillaceae bacterium]|nr:MAG: 6-phosphofructokinase [Alphaproteobacteria bacterium GWF2_58_20]HAU29347.1 6-phosphofructokinase [Rhodospirillaceae bacterium]
MVKRIGLLTSGGDCAGLNAALRAVVHAASHNDIEVLGIVHSTAGLFSRPPNYAILTPERCDANMLRMGGTILGTTNKGDPFAFPMPDGSKKDRSEEIIEGLRMIGVEVLVAIGGDGSLSIINRLCKQGGIPLIGIPKTIDNDVGLTEKAIGFDTAVDVATEALDRLQPTAASHDRVMVLEVMGRDAGHIAMSAGIAGGADVILIPEIPYDIEKVAAKITEIRDGGRNFSLVVVSEAVKMADGTKSFVEYADGQKRMNGVGAHIADHIARITGAETRVTVLGHLQRGGMPSAQDRILASVLGTHAVDLILQGKTNRMVGWTNRRVIDVDIEEVVHSCHCVKVDGPMVKSARSLGICLGD